MYYLKLHHKKGQSVYKTIAATRVVMCMRILWFLAIASFACILLYVCVVSQCILILMHHVLKHRCTLTLTHRKAAAAHRAHQHTSHHNYYHYYTLPHRPSSCRRHRALRNSEEHCTELQHKYRKAKLPFWISLRKSTEQRIRNASVQYVVILWVVASGRSARERVFHINTIIVYVFAAILAIFMLQHKAQAYYALYGCIHCEEQLCNNSKRTENLMPQSGIDNCIHS